MSVIERVYRLAEISAEVTEVEKIGLSLLETEKLLDEVHEALNDDVFAQVSRSLGMVRQLLLTLADRHDAPTVGEIRIREDLRRSGVPLDVLPEPVDEEDGHQSSLSPNEPPQSPDPQSTQPRTRTKSKT